MSLTSLLVGISKSAPIIGGIAGAVSSAFGAERQNKEAKAAAARQMEFQRENYKNRYQWTMADMKAAGLNPMLAYSQGTGGGVGGGSSYSPANVGAAAGAGGIAAGNSALSVRRANTELKQVEASTELLKRQATTETNKAWQLMTQASKELSQQELARAQRVITEQLFKIRGADVASARTLQKLRTTRGGKAITITDEILRAINPFARTMTR